MVVLRASLSMRKLLRIVLIFLLAFSLLAQALPARADQGSGGVIYIPLVVRQDQPNRPPNMPSAPAPASGAANQPTNPKLTWSGGDPDGNPVSYTLRLDTVNPPVMQAAANLTTAAYQASGLSPATQYYWRVEAVDSWGLKTSGPVWSFQTTNQIAAPANRLDTAELVYCAVTSAGTVQCWGDPNAGWTGRIFPSESNVPVTIPGLSGVKSVGVGDGFACALTTSGGVKCWGNNISGQLGNGTTTPSTAPVNVSGLTSGVKQIAVGGLFACALLDTGAVKCWGNNTNGQLGINSKVNQSTPAQVVGMASGVGAISAGERHACAIVSGALSCWGSSEFGQIGSIQIEIFEFWSPTPVHGMSSGVIAVTAGTKYTCAIKTGGALKCWGLNNGGELGTGDEVQGWLPMDVVGMQSGVKAVAPGTHTCAISGSGEAKCWGWNTMGELGGGTQSTNSLTPVTVNGISGVVEIASGIESTCALLSSGSLKCWGSNKDSQLGAGLTATLSLVPVTVTGW